MDLRNVEMLANTLPNEDILVFVEGLEGCLQSKESF
jgi:hypothetical protein